VHEFQLFVASPEDIIVAKLEWAKLGASHRQLEDVAAVLRVQGQALDMAYLQKWVSELGLSVEWERARGMAGSG
jgi:hypothetical protein